MDTLKAVQVFVEIAHQGSLTKAADKLSMSRAMVSRYLEYLENRFGARLMQRNTRRVALTQAGEEALVYCQTMLDQEQLLFNLSAETHTSGLIRVTAGHFMAREYLYDAIAQFGKILPDVKFDVVSLEQSLDLIEHNIDVALRVASKLPEGFESRDLGELPLALVASPAYLASKPALNSPMQLKQHRCLVHQQAHWQNWELTNSKGQTRSFPVEYAFYCNDVYGLLEMALRHQGITMLPKVMVADYLASGHLVEVLPEYQLTPFHLAVMYPSKAHIPLMVQRFVEFLTQYLSQHPKILA